MSDLKKNLNPRRFSDMSPFMAAIVLICICVMVFACRATAAAAPASVEQWDIFEISLDGPSDGSPFVDVTLSAVFSSNQKAIEASGFYDGDGVYRIRFMPPQQGQWRYLTRSNRNELAGKTGEFTATKPSPTNHGPVGVRNTYHFAYADGTPFWELGTTCYAWTHQGDALEEQTLGTLAQSTNGRTATPAAGPASITSFTSEKMRRRNRYSSFPDLADLPTACRSRSMSLTRGT